LFVLTTSIGYSEYTEQTPQEVTEDHNIASSAHPVANMRDTSQEIGSEALPEIDNAYGMM